jgi:hypothetical protein
MAEAPSTDPIKQARDALVAAHADLIAASKRGVVDDGKIFFGAAAAVDVAVECLIPPSVDRELAAQNCDEALKVAKMTRAYAQREAGGSNAQLLDNALKNMELALKLIRRDLSFGVT